MTKITRQPRFRLSDWLLAAYALICGLWSGAAFVRAYYATGSSVGGLTPLMIGAAGLFGAYLFGRDTTYMDYVGRVVVMAAGMGGGYFLASVSHLAS